jgi:hypothetical protein
MLEFINIDGLKLFGIEVFDSKGFTELVLRFSINLFVIWFIARIIYYPSSKRKDYLFTYILISTVIFLLCYMLNNVKLQLGFALGLFAVFGILRYRTDPMPIKEMTYLFIIIGMSVVNALSNKKISYSELFFTNFVIIIITYGLERIWLLRREICKTIVYEKIDLIKPEKRNELLIDLEQRTGLKINRIEIGQINFMRDTARVNIYYFGDENSDTDATRSIRDDDDDDD